MTSGIGRRARSGCAAGGVPVAPCAEGCNRRVAAKGKLHHAAFDRHFLTVRPDYTIEVRRSILEEEDGPMLLHGLKGMHDRPIYLPRELSLLPETYAW